MGLSKGEPACLHYKFDDRGKHVSRHPINVQLRGCPSAVLILKQTAVAVSTWFGVSNVVCHGSSKPNAMTCCSSCLFSPCMIQILYAANNQEKATKQIESKISAICYFYASLPRIFWSRHTVNGTTFFLALPLASLNGRT